MYYPAKYNPYQPYPKPSQGVQDYKTVVLYSVLGLGTATALFLGTRHLVKQAQTNTAESHSMEEGEPATYAKQLKMSFDNDMWFGMGTDEDLLFRTLSEIPTQGMYSKVQKAYLAMYKANLNADMESELSSDLYNQALRIISSKPS